MANAENTEAYFNTTALACLSLPIIFGLCWVQPCGGLASVQTPEGFQSSSGAAVRVLKGTIPLK